MTTPPAPLNEKERYAANAMAAVLHKVVVAMRVGKADADDPYCWDDLAAFELFSQLREALFAAERVRFGPPRYFEAACASCLHYRPYSSGRADQAPVDRRDFDQPRTRPTAEVEADAVGICTESPPQRLHMPMNKNVHESSHCPKVHGNWVCGRWEAITSRRGRL